MKGSTSDHAWHGYALDCPDCEGATRITAVAFNSRAEVLFQAKCRRRKKCGLEFQSIVPFKTILGACLKLDGIELPKQEDDTALSSRYL